MAAVTDPIAIAPGRYEIDVTYDNVTGAIATLSWTITTGTVTVTVHQAGKPDLSRTVTSSGSVTVPAGYALVKGTKGDWKFATAGAATYEESWTP